MVVCVAFGGGPRPPVELPPSQGPLDAQVDVLDGPKAVPSTLNRRLTEVQTVDACQVTNSILFCYLYTIRGQCRKSALSVNAQSRFASVVLGGVLGP